MSDLTAITESLVTNGYTQTPGLDHREAEFTRTISDGTLEVVTIDYLVNLVIKQRYSAKGTQIDYSEVEMAKPGSLALALRLAA